MRHLALLALVRFLGRRDLVRKMPSAAMTADRALLIRNLHQALARRVRVTLPRDGIARYLVPTPADLAAVVGGARLPFRADLGLGAADLAHRFLLQREGPPRRGQTRGGDELALQHLGLLDLNLVRGDRLPGRAGVYLVLRAAVAGERGHGVSGGEPRLLLLSLATLHRRLLAVGKQHVLPAIAHLLHEGEVLARGGLGKLQVLVAVRGGRDFSTPLALLHRTLGAVLPPALQSLLLGGPRCGGVNASGLGRVTIHVTGLQSGLLFHI